MSNLCIVADPIFASNLTHKWNLLLKAFALKQSLLEYHQVAFNILKHRLTGLLKRSTHGA